VKRSRDVGTFLAVIVAIAVVGIAVMVVLPATDASTRRPTLRACRLHPGECATSVLIAGETITAAPPEDPEGAAARNADSSWARGRDVYIREGCFYCHTQQVRPVLADVGLGPVSNAGDYVFQEPPLLGQRRVGPDLFNAATRQGLATCDGVKNFLRDPGSLYSWSSMPSYNHVTGRDLDDLATYLVRLRPTTAPGPDTCEAPPQEVTSTAAPGVTATAAPGATATASPTP
jgi:cbb3-type cytochrome oxidase cytochrome c subunit